MSEGLNHCFRLLLVGVGGQGCVTASRVVGEAAADAGLEVRIGELHGMAQRGGMVESGVVIGPGSTPMIELRQADVVLGLEPLEALRALPRMTADTHVLLNYGRIVPFIMTHRGVDYPPLEAILEPIQRVTTRVTLVDATSLARETGEARALNVVMLGVMAEMGLLPFPSNVLKEAVVRRSPPAFREANRRAFELGALEVGKQSTT